MATTDKPGPGHNKPPSQSDRELKAFHERIDAIEAEIKALQEDKKDVFAEAKIKGYDTKAMRVLRRLWKMDTEDREDAITREAEQMRALGWDLV